MSRNNVNFKTVLFDVYLLAGVFAIVTAGNFLFPQNWNEMLKDHPGQHRLLMSLITFALLIPFWARLLKKEPPPQSNIISWLTKVPFSPFQWTFVFFGIVGFTLAYSSFIRHHVFRSSFDFAIFAQAIWNTLHGNLLFSSIKGGICLLGDHVSPILIAFAPLFSVWDDPVVLLVVQAIAAASGVFPIFFISQKVNKSEKIALVFSVAYLLYLPLRNAVRFDFHPELFGDVLILWAFYFIVDEKLWRASMLLILTLLTKEVACAPVALLGLYSFFVRKKRMFGMIVFVGSICVFLFSILWVAPHFSGEEYFYLRGNYAAWREKGIIPFLGHMFQGSTFSYIKKIFMPVGFFSFLNPSALGLTLPVLMQNLTARNVLARSTFFHYTAFLTSFVFISAIFGFQNFIEWASKQKKIEAEWLKKIGIFWLLSASLLFAGVSEWRIIVDYQVKDSPHFGHIRAYMKSIPSSFSIRTHEFFAPHLYNRQGLHIYENQNPKEGASYEALNSDLVVLDRMLLAGTEHEDIKRLTGNGYEIVHEHDGFYVLANKKISYPK